MKKCLIAVGVLCVAIAILGRSSPVLAGRDKAPAGPERELCIFVTYPVGHAQGPPEATDQEDDYRLLNGGLHLATLPVSYRVDTTGAPGGALAAVVAGFEEWDGETSTEVFADPDVGSANTVSWDALAYPGAVAVAYVWYIPRTKEIAEFHIVFNSDLPWSTGGETDKYDVQNVGTHEVGHTLALSDLRPPKDGALTMYAFTSLGETKKRDLGVGDVLGIQAIYGG